LPNILNSQSTQIEHRGPLVFGYFIKNSLNILPANMFQNMVVQQLICDKCQKVILEKEGESYLDDGRFPISKEEAALLDKEHRGHECHIEAVKKGA
jgi:phage FluMu protein Com